MAHELARLRAGGGPAGAVHDVVETKLKETKHVLAGDTLTPAGLGVDVAELRLGRGRR